MRILEWFGFELKSAAPSPADGVTQLTIEQIRHALKEEQNGTGNHKVAMRSSAVLACARVIAEGIAQVPFKLYRDADGSRAEAVEHPLYDILHRRPNDWQTSFEFREQIGLHLVLTNNAYVYINRVNGRIAELYAFDPGTVSVEQTIDLDLIYRVTTKGRQVTVPAGDMWHIRGLSWNGWRGDDAVRLARETIGLAKATEAYGAALFENGARPGGILSTRAGSTTALTTEQRSQIKDMWTAQHQGAGNAHKTVLLPYDLDFTPIAGTANDAQWIESRKFLVEEVCRFFKVRPIMVMQSGATSYASVEMEMLSHLTHTLMPWFSRIEQSAEANLLTREERASGYQIKLVSQALLRGSTTERAAYYNTMVGLGAMTINEVRSKEDMPRSSDPLADELRPAANLFGTQQAAQQQNNEVNR